jgi:hypothetical protein
MIPGIGGQIYVYTVNTRPDEWHDISLSKRHYRLNQGFNSGSIPKYPGIPHSWLEYSWREYSGNQNFGNVYGFCNSNRVRLDIIPICSFF